MSFASAEHDRMLAGVLMPCAVVAVDLGASPPVCRVSNGQWTSTWVRWHSQAAGKARHFRAPSLGEQGMLVSPSGNPALGTFVPGLYSAAGPAPDNRDHVEVWAFDDGGSLVYDWKARTYTIAVPSGQVLVKVGSSQLSITNSTINLTGKVSITGDVSIAGQVAITGPLTVSADIIGGARIIDTAGNTANHKH